MQFGIQFFPVESPDTNSGASYWDNALAIVDEIDDLGLTSLRTVEHYFHRYGGYSPSPLAFFAAAAQRTKKARLISGAVLPAFSHPLKLASEIALVDALSHGRLEVGFARAFLPHEFERFGVPLDGSRERFEEAVALIVRLLREEKVAHSGKHWSFPETTILPRPIQRPHPPVWIAAVQTPASFEAAGRLGYGIMAIPLAGETMRDLLAAYRKAWKAAGHPGEGRAMLAFHMYCAPSMAEARETCEEGINDYLRAFADAAGAWTSGTSSKDYAGYDKLISGIEKANWDTQVANGAMLVGTPDHIARTIQAYSKSVGGFEIASMQVSFGRMPLAKSLASMRLFSREVMPAVA